MIICFAVYKLLFSFSPTYQFLGLFPELLEPFYYLFKNLFGVWCVCARTWVQAPTEARRGHQTSHSWNDRQLWTASMILELKLGPLKEQQVLWTSLQPLWVLSEKPCLCQHFEVTWDTSFTAQFTFLSINILFHLFLLFSSLKHNPDTQWIKLRLLSLEENIFPYILAIQYV